MTVTLRSIRSVEIEEHLPELVELLIEAVNGGASLGFIPPLQITPARNYWLSLRTELLADSRVIVGVFLANRLVGTGQLTFSPWANAPHRASIQQVCVAKVARGRGIGKHLMTVLHQEARERGRSLLLLNVRCGDVAEQFFRALGYEEIGIVPGFTLGAGGEHYDDVSMYLNLTPPSKDA